jgi:apolipoprotein N-acyltransferase
MLLKKVDCDTPVLFRMMILQLIICVAVGLIAGQIPLFEGLNWLPLVIFIPVIIILSLNSYKKNLLFSFFFIIALKASISSFIIISRIQYNNNKQDYYLFIMYIIYILLTSLPSIFSWSLLGKIIKKYQSFWIVLFPTLIVVSEYLTGLYDFFPIYLGEILYKYDKLFNLISYTGIYGATFFVIFINSLIADIIIKFKNKKNIPYRTICFSLSFCALVIIIGNYRYNVIENQLQNSKTISLLQIQESLSYKKLNEMRINKKKRLEDFRHWVENTIQHPYGKIDLVVWPENVIPYLMNKHQVDAILKRISKKLKTEIIGGVGLFSNSNKKSKKIYNAAFYYDSLGNRKAVYKKQKLVPFNEYLPYKDKFNFLYKIFKTKALNLTPANDNLVIQGEKAKMSVAICYESIFPDVIRGFKDAELILNLSNDIWLQNSNGMKLHMIAAGVNASLFGKPIYISSYSGISVLFEPNGKISYQTKPLENVNRIINVRLYNTNTFYEKWGNWFVILCLIILFISYLQAKLKSNNGI